MNFRLSMRQAPSCTSLFIDGSKHCTQFVGVNSTIYPPGNKIFVNKRFCFVMFQEDMLDLMLSPRSIRGQDIIILAKTPQTRNLSFFYLLW